METISILVLHGDMLFLETIAHIPHVPLVNSRVQIKVLLGFDNITYHHHDPPLSTQYAHHINRKLASLTSIQYQHFKSIRV